MARSEGNRREEDVRLSRPERRSPPSARRHDTRPEKHVFQDRTLHTEAQHRMVYSNSSDSQCCRITPMTSHSDADRDLRMPTLRDLIAPIFRHKLAGFLTALTLFTGTTVMVLLSPKQYRGGNEDPREARAGGRDCERRSQGGFTGALGCDRGRAELGGRAAQEPRSS